MIPPIQNEKEYMRTLATSFVCSILLVLGGCCKRISIEYSANAEVLAINQKILEGQSIATLYASLGTGGEYSGKISNDVNKVSIRLYIGDSLFLEDIRVNHAMLVHYGEKDSLPVRLVILYHPSKHVNSFMRILLNETEVGIVNLTDSYAKSLYDMIVGEKL